MRSDYAEAHSNYGNLCVQRKEYQAAIASYTEALSLQADLADAWANRGVAQQQLKNRAEARADFERAIALNPKQANYFVAYADLCIDEQSYTQAQELLARALALNVMSASTATLHNTRGRMYMALGQYADAAEAFLTSLELDPLNAASYKYAAIANYHLGDSTNSQKLIKEALRLDQRNPELWWLDCFVHIPAAIDSNEQGLAIRATMSKRLQRFSRLANKYDIPAEAIGNIGPFYLMYHGIDDKTLLQEYAKVCSDVLHNKYEKFLPKIFPARDDGEISNRKIKICVTTAHIKQHSVWHSHLEGLYRRLDRTRFELHTINLTGAKAAQCEFAQQHSDSYCEMFGVEDEAVIAKVLALQADVLLYPEVGLHAQTGRLAALRLLKNQVAMWGNPETTGLSTIDGFISLDEIEGAKAQDHYSENLMRMPLSEHYYAKRDFQSQGKVAERLGLDAKKKWVICSGTAFKFQYKFFDFFGHAWQNLGGVQFVFFQQDTLVYKSLESRLSSIVAAHKKPDNSLLFLPWLPEDDYYELMHASSALLDGLNFSGFNTAIKALECGLPIVNLASDLARENFSSGLLRSIGLGDLVQPSSEAAFSYLQRLLDDEEYCLDTKARIRINSSKIFNQLGIMIGLENYLEKMVLA